MAASAVARDVLISRAADLSLKPTLSAHPQLANHFFIRHLLSAVPRKRAAISCLISKVDSGGVSDEFISTRKSGFEYEFSVIANMLNIIESLHNSVISKKVSDSAKDSMKQTISTMLGLLPSDLVLRLLHQMENGSYVASM